jgi:hypothetical protein
MPWRREDDFLARGSVTREAPLENVGSFHMAPYLGLVRSGELDEPTGEPTYESVRAGSGQ